jgi:chromosome segregation ATPase
MNKMIEGGRAGLSREASFQRPDLPPRTELPEQPEFSSSNDILKLKQRIEQIQLQIEENTDSIHKIRGRYVSHLPEYNPYLQTTDALEEQRRFAQVSHDRFSGKLGRLQAERDDLHRSLSEMGWFGRVLGLGGVKKSLEAAERYLPVVKQEAATAKAAWQDIEAQIQRRHDEALAAFKSDPNVAKLHAEIETLRTKLDAAEDRLDQLETPNE